MAELLEQKEQLTESVPEAGGGGPRGPPATQPPPRPGGPGALGARAALWRG